MCYRNRTTDGRKHHASAANPSMAEAKKVNNLHASFPRDFYVISLESRPLVAI